MAILKIKRLIEDLENNTTRVLGTVNKVAQTAGIASTATLAVLATSAGKAGTAQFSTAARNAYYASSGTAVLSGTGVWWNTSGIQP